MTDDLQTPEAPADLAVAEETAPEAEAGEAAELVEVKPERPAGVPEKFWDPEAGSLRTDALLKSYLELERKLGAKTQLPLDEMDEAARQQLREALGVPKSPDDYKIEARDELVQPDPEINAKLHEAGFTEEQAQLVYDLAADHLVPLIDEAVGELEAVRDVERLAAHFGGEEGWANMARQIKTWGEANLAPDVFETLAASYDGVLAMHQMMQAREPAVLRDQDGPKADVDQDALAQMMRDPRYWRDKDPAFVAQVTDGFKRLYGR